MSLFADVYAVRGWSLGEMLVLVIVIAACLAVAFVALHQFGIHVPEWVIHIAWIVAVAFVAIIAIRFLLTM